VEGGNGEWKWNLSGARTATAAPKSRGSTGRPGGHFSFIIISGRELAN